MRHIVVLGGGFAGLHAVHLLERDLAERRKVQITLINDSPSFLFTPLLPNVANGELGADSILLPLEDHVREDTEFVQARVTSIDLEAQEIHTETLSPLPYDYLIVAAGSKTWWPKDEASWMPHSLTCKTVRDALLIRDTIESAFHAAQMMEGEERARHLRFVFAGGGPTGVELAAELWSALKIDVFPRLDPGLRDAAKFILVDDQSTLLSRMHPSLQRIALTRLEREGFELRLGTAVTHRTSDTVTLSDGETMACDHFFWCAGVTPNPLAQTPGFELDDTGRIKVNWFLQALGHENVWAVGDIAVTRDPVAQTAQAAKQQGPHAAQNLIAVLSGRAQTPWSMTPVGDLVTLGRGHAGVHLKGVTLEGLPAYALYRVVYAALMPTAMKKLRIMTDWISHDLARTSVPRLESK